MTTLTYGRKALLAVLQRTHARDVAARCAVAPSRVSEWLSGVTRPCPRSRVRLSRSYGIPLDAWERPAPRVHVTQRS